MQKIKLWLKVIALFLLWGVLVPRYAKAQMPDRYIVTTAGQTLSAGGYSLDFTFGEPVAQTFENGMTLSQGFQQQWLTTTPVEDIQGEDWAVRIFPNPTVGLLHIETETVMNVYLFDLNGRLLQSAELQTGISDMNLSQLPAGSYMLHLHTTPVNGSKAFRITKTQ